MPPAEREKLRGTNSFVPFLGEMMCGRSSVSGYLLPSCTANCAEREEICRKFRDQKNLSMHRARDVCPISAPAAAW